MQSSYFNENWKKLQNHLEQDQIPHLRELLKDADRSDQMFVEYDGITLDFSHQKMTSKTLALLIEYAQSRDLKSRIQDMFDGKAINCTENRPVLHVALRSKEEDGLKSDDKTILFPLVLLCIIFLLKNKVNEVLNRIKYVSEKICNGQYRLSQGDTVDSVIVIGIGGSHLSVEATYLALSRFIREKGINLRFLANVDPLAFHKATAELNPASTLVIIVSKTFTTAETMLNARTVKQWLSSALPSASLESHFLAVSSATDKCAQFGVSPENVFPIWDWVGGRFSGTSAVGVLPLSIAFGFDVCRSFLDGARSVDRHFLEAPFSQNIPVLMGLAGLWNSSFLKMAAHAIVPYCEGLERFPAHIQQVDMEEGLEAGEIVLGEAGTNAQHSFFQLMHQGRKIPVDFIGFAQCSNDSKVDEDDVSAHDELMSNFFAQADALAIGKHNENGHKNFDGDRPSQWILFKAQNAHSVGQLLALYEHRVAVQGFLWGINSFDQFGVQIGKELGVGARKQIKRGRMGLSLDENDQMSHSAKKLLRKYLSESEDK